MNDLIIFDFVELSEQEYKTPEGSLAAMALANLNFEGLDKPRIESTRRETEISEFNMARRCSR